MGHSRSRTLSLNKQTILQRHNYPPPFIPIATRADMLDPGANAAILCYDITSTTSFTELGHWLHELKATLPSDTILHIVGTKADLVAEDPPKRKVAFESCVAYAAENLYPGTNPSPLSPNTQTNTQSNTPLPTPLQ